MLKKIGTGIWFCLVFTYWCKADSTHTDTIIPLATFEVKSNRLFQFSAGNKMISIDSADLAKHLSSSLAELLRYETSLYIKSYGSGNLATSSFRGGSAAHTAVLWNGFNINNAANGQVDFSLIPLFAVNTVTVQHGGGGTLWGSGAVGGSIHLQNKLSFYKGIEASACLTAGSFGKFSKQTSFILSRKRWASSVSIFNTKAKNNFSFINPYTSEKQIQANAEQQGTGFITDHSFTMKENMWLNFSAWYQQNNRNIPVAINQITNKAYQKDEVVRCSSEWKYFRNAFNYFIRTAYFNEQMLYVNETSTIQSRNKTNTVIAETETRWFFLPNQCLNVGSNHTFISLHSSGFEDKHHQNKTAFFISHGTKYFKEKLKTTISGRKEFLQHQNIPFTYAAGISYLLFEEMEWKAAYSNVFRLPTFNDLYWQPGGNKQLLPENGYSSEIGFLIDTKERFKSWHFKTEQTYFSRVMHNWIIWLPQGSFWAPQNIMEVWSRGVETHSSLIYLAGKTNISLFLLTNYVVSTNQKIKSENDASFDKQLIYVPMYSGSARLSVSNRFFEISVANQYTGYRYISSDNSEYLLPFYNTHARFSYILPLKEISLSLFFSVENIFNTSYQLVQSYAMPLRNYNTGIIIKYHKSKK
ncbi:MAG: TonB-dependent receptor [Bacteroidetes bacterium]|nr:Vitamin B12 transporter BtuB [Flavobacteriales bacterium]NOG94681.1 TonB-dependent receptor [Bacteroidota bacterium]WKZ74377.1 MAG: TonB-dependent receptor [Vicingaceae bacterium]MCL4817002.1 TonB-dependent receptor [Flavobacteriales bacterium]CAG0982570.1 Vitamin B12 transporter BtuB [Flavobacteriales bacterium]